MPSFISATALTHRVIQEYDLFLNSVFLPQEGSVLLSKCWPLVLLTLLYRFEEVHVTINWKEISPY